MCVGSKPKASTITSAPVAPPITSPIDADQDAKRAGEDERRRRMVASGRSDTILTGGLGDTGFASSQGGRKKLLGQ